MIEVGDVYQHINTGNIYVVLACANLKYLDKWEPCIIYRSAKLAERHLRFVRPESEFIKKFKKDVGV